MNLNKDNLVTEDLLLIRRLFDEHCVSAFSLHRDSMLSVGQIVQLIDRFEADKLVTTERTVSQDVNLSLTEFGRSWFLENETWLIQGNRERLWRQTPKEFRQSFVEDDQEEDRERLAIAEELGD